MARTASPWSSRSAATACSHRRSHGLHAHGSRALGAHGGGAHARRDRCKVVCVHIGGSACDPVDLKHLLILYGRKDAPCADHSTTALRSRCDRPYGVCVRRMRMAHARMRMRLVAPPLRRSRAAARRAAARRAAARRTAARHTAARGAPSLVAPPLVAPPLSRRALLSPLAPSPCLPRRPPPSSCCCTNPAHGLKNHWASAMGE